jgi:hypothetical protein
LPGHIHSSTFCPGAAGSTKLQSSWSSLSRYSHGRGRWSPIRSPLSLWPVWLGNEPVGPYLFTSLAIPPAYIPTYTSQLRVVDPRVIGFLFRCRVRVVRNCCPELSQRSTFTFLGAFGDPPVGTTDRYRAQGNTGGCSEGYYSAYFLSTIPAESDRQS